MSRLKFEEINPVTKTDSDSYLSSDRSISQDSPISVSEKIIDMNETPVFFTINPAVNMTSILHIDLTPYIETFTKDQERHAAYGRELHSAFIGLSSAVYWQTMLSAATQGLADTTIEIIEASPANIFMRESFVEILKNVMDEAILHWVKDKSPPILNLTLSIALDIDQITLTLCDDGRGFPMAFLSKVNSRTTQLDYLKNKSTSDKIRMDESIPTLFGGASKGLRNLIERVWVGDHLGEKNDRLEKAAAKFIQPVIAKLILDNAPQRGARIQLITSVSPLQEIIHVATIIKEGNDYSMLNTDPNDESTFHYPTLDILLDVSDEKPVFELHQPQTDIKQAASQGVSKDTFFSRQEMLEVKNEVKVDIKEVEANLVTSDLMDLNS